MLELSSNWRVPSSPRGAASNDRLRVTVMFDSVVSGRLLGFNLGDWMLLIGGCLVSGMLAFLM